MDVSCPSCSARYVADDEKIRGKTARMRCKACSAVWMVTGAPAVAQPAAAVAPAPPSKPAEPKRAAVVKRGFEREHRDLFAARDSDEGAIEPSFAPAPKFGCTSVGARNETSVLFRVDQIRDAGRAKAPAPTAPFEMPIEGPPSRVSRVDDEGVIDLKALASAPPGPMAAAVAPLFSEPPPVAVEVDRAPLSIERFTKMNGKLLATIGGAAAFLVVAVVSLSYMFRSEVPVAHTNAVLAPPVETAVPAPLPAVAPAPIASAETSESPADPPTETKVKRGKGKIKGAKGVTTAAKAPPKIKAADPCGCKGNFNCIIACTAKGR